MTIFMEESQQISYEFLEESNKILCALYISDVITEASNENIPNYSKKLPSESTIKMKEAIQKFREALIKFITKIRNWFINVIAAMKNNFYAMESFVKKHENELIEKINKIKTFEYSGNDVFYGDRDHDIETIYNRSETVMKPLYKKLEKFIDLVVRGQEVGEIDTELDNLINDVDKIKKSLINVDYKNDTFKVDLDSTSIKNIIKDIKNSKNTITYLEKYHTTEESNLRALANRLKNDTHIIEANRKYITIINKAIVNIHSLYSFIINMMRKQYMQFFNILRTLYSYDESTVTDNINSIDSSYNIFETAYNML